VKYPILQSSLRNHALQNLAMIDRRGTVDPQKVLAELNQGVPTTTACELLEKMFEVIATHGEGGTVFIPKPVANEPVEGLVGPPYSEGASAPIHATA
jgi:hypothetical protein